MNEIKNMLKKKKPCFGQYENWDFSWHCNGCIVQDLCQSYANEINEAKEKETKDE